MASSRGVRGVRGVGVGWDQGGDGSAVDAIGALALSRERISFAVFGALSAIVWPPG